MKLLIITNNPQRASFRQRIEVYLPVLSESGIDCEVVRFPSSLIARHKLLRSTGRYDGVFLQKRRLNPLDVLSLRGRCRKLIYDLDDAIMFSDKFPDKPGAKRRNDFARTVKFASTVICGNGFLAEQARRYNKNVEILPTGLDVGQYDLDIAKSDDMVRLVWIGSKSTLMYLEHIKPALEQIGKMYDNVVLRIVCDAFFDLENMPVEKCRWSLGTHAADIVSCDIGLAPLPDNNFTRGKCGFKILQYQAASLATVASPVGVNSDFVTDGVTGFCARQTDRWVTSIKTLIDDIRLRNRMGLAAKNAARDFDLAVIGKRLTEIIKNGLKQ